MSTNYYLCRWTELGTLRVIHLGKYSSYKDGTFASNWAKTKLETLVKLLLHKVQEFQIYDEYGKVVKPSEFFKTMNAPRFEVVNYSFS